MTGIGTILSDEYEGATGTDGDLLMLPGHAIKTTAWYSDWRVKTIYEKNGTSGVYTRTFPSPGPSIISLDNYKKK